MFADLDETVRHILVRHVPLDLSEVEVSFEAPDREWSGRLSRPAVNCFLYDVRENVELRAAGWEQQRRNGDAVTRKPPVRIDATYQVTVWARAPEDEHRLLWRVLAALMRNPVIQADDLQGALKDQPFAIQTKTAQPNSARANPADLWQAVDNRIRPALTYVATLALDPLHEYVSPLVFTRVVRVQDLDAGTLDMEVVEIGGRVKSQADPRRPVGGAIVRIEGSGGESITDDDGRFTLRSSSAGPVTLVVRNPGGGEISRRFEIPSPNYDLEV